VGRCGPADPSRLCCRCASRSRQLCPAVSCSGAALRPPAVLAEAMKTRRGRAADVAQKMTVTGRGGAGRGGAGRGPATTAGGRGGGQIADRRPHRRLRPGPGQGAPTPSPAGRHADRSQVHPPSRPVAAAAGRARGCSRGRGAGADATHAGCVRDACGIASLRRASLRCETSTARVHQPAKRVLV
jgi:hypothetical protein